MASPSLDAGTSVPDGTMPLSRIFLLCFAAGIAIGYFAVARPSRVEPQDAQPAASSPVAAPASHPHVGTHAPVAATPHKPTAAARSERQSLTARAPNLSRDAASPPKEPADDVARAQAQRLASDEPLTREDVRVLLEQVLAGKLPRDLTAKDYDRLADAVLRVRAAERILQTVEESPETTRVRAAQQN